MPLQRRNVARQSNHRHPPPEARPPRPKYTEPSEEPSGEPSEELSNDEQSGNNSHRDTDELDEERAIEPTSRPAYQPITTIDWRGEICQFLNLTLNSPNKEILDALQEASIKLQEVEQLRAAALSVQGPPRYQVLHAVRCMAWHNREDTVVYLHEPWVEDMERVHLRGANAIGNIELYLERNKDVKFLVYREYTCCRPSSQNARMSQLEDNLQIDPSTLMDGERIRHVCPELRDALVDIADKSLQGVPHPEFSEQVFGDENIAYPYLWWYHRRGQIEIGRAELDDQSRRFLDIFRGYLRKHLKKEWNEVQSLASRGKIKAKYLSYIYVPGEIVVAPRQTASSQFLAACVLQTFRTSRRVQHIQPLGVDLEIASWTFDGTFRREVSWPYIEPVASADIGSNNNTEFDITDLSVYPLRFAQPKFVQDLRTCGQMYWKCRKRNYVCYKNAEGSELQPSVESRFMVDMVTYNQMHPNKNTSAPARNDSDVLSPELMEQDNPGLGDDFFLCLPTTIPGFNMQKKEWMKLDVARIEDVKWNTRAFEHLVIDSTAKKLVQAVVTNQLEIDEGADVMQGKGNGLFILLHGGPGTGKTLTAESVAEVAKRPLYRVTCGDIGTNPEEVEKYLETVLLLGKTWGCVVLLDEADVFLEQRSLQNLQRNSLVSIFLRVLDYYDGILILTTNRVGIFDEAFKSRIQLNLRYKNLDLTQRRQIWQNFITRLEEIQDKYESTPRKSGYTRAGVDAKDLAAHVEDLAKVNLNGREIRNSISTARQLATHEKEPLQYKHLRGVIDEMRKFDDYLLEVKQFTADELQRDKMAR